MAACSAWKNRSKKILLTGLFLFLVSNTGNASAKDDTLHQIGDVVMRFNDLRSGLSDGAAESLVSPRAARRIECHTDGSSVGCYLTDNQRVFWDADVIAAVSGSSGGSAHKNVTGFYLLDGAQLTIGGDLTLTLANAAPATRGASAGADVAHYYMSGVYAGYGGRTRDGDNADTRFTLCGALDMDVVGVGLQANKDGYIIVGGGRIVTHEISTDTYALLAEEGCVFMNTGEDGHTPGTETVYIHGNLGVLNKNYGMDPNPDRHGSFISLALSTPDAALIGAILNEYEESGKNRHNAGVDLYLSNGARWNNQWIGAAREKAVQPRVDAESYLYRGSKVRALSGGVSEEAQGNIFQEEEKPITVSSYEGCMRVIYRCTPEGRVTGGGFIIKHAAPGACITLRLDSADLDTDIAAPAAQERCRQLFETLAGKLYYQGYAAGERHLSGRLELAAGLAVSAPILRSAEICFTPEGQGKLCEG